jgi:hypothetical protein
MADVVKGAVRRPTRPSAFPRRAQLIGGPLAIFQLVEQLEHVLGKRRVLAQIITQFLADGPNPRLIVIFRHAAECPLLLLSCRLRSLTNTVPSRSKKGGRRFITKFSLASALPWDPITLPQRLSDWTTSSRAGSAVCPHSLLHQGFAAGVRSPHHGRNPLPTRSPAR